MINQHLPFYVSHCTAPEYALAHICTHHLDLSGSCLAVNICSGALSCSHKDAPLVASPYAGPGRATNVWRAFEWVTGERLDDPAVIARSAAIARPLPVPATAIWSRSDGPVAGTICRCDHARAVEVRSGHLGVQMRPETLSAIAATLARSHRPA